ncbi:MAG TPA: SRPBCC family protein [Pseudonocardia sp.]|nr:SRPBCC family protein [Pseudonocardia sp.]
MVITTDVEVDAAPAVLWAVLARPQTWPDWTESMDAVELLDGGLELGSRVRITQPGMPPMVWTVSEFEQGRVFTWTSSAGGVTTLASHTVGPLDGGRRSRLVLGLTQRGPLAPLVGLLLGRRTRRYVGQETAGLKAAAEDRARALDPSAG